MPQLHSQRMHAVGCHAPVVASPSVAVVVAPAVVALVAAGVVTVAWLALVSVALMVSPLAS